MLIFAFCCQLLPPFVVCFCYCHFVFFYKMFTKTPGIYRSFLGRGRKIIPKFGLFPTVFSLFLRLFQTTVWIPRFFSVEFVVSPEITKQYLESLWNWKYLFNRRSIKCGVALCLQVALKKFFAKMKIWNVQKNWDFFHNIPS